MWDWTACTMKITMIAGMIGAEKPQVTKEEKDVKRDQ